MTWKQCLIASSTTLFSAKQPITLVWIFSKGCWWVLFILSWFAIRHRSEHVTLSFQTRKSFWLVNNSLIQQCLRPYAVRCTERKDNNSTRIFYLFFSFHLQLRKENLGKRSHKLCKKLRVWKQKTKMNKTPLTLTWHCWIK